MQRHTVTHVIHRVKDTIPMRDLVAIRSRTTHPSYLKDSLMKTKKNGNRFVTSHIVASYNNRKRANSNDRFTFSQGVDFQGTKEDCNTIEVQSRAATNNIIF